jgi:chromatin remodeling complex protein RSC6
MNHSEIGSAFESIIDNLTSFKVQISNIQQQIRVLDKSIKKQMKSHEKDVAKRAKKTARAPSGFARPSKVTKELCEFMNKEEGTKIARTEVTRALVSYIKSNKLENKENSKIISPDDKLKFLLGVEESDELTYFNIQKYMNKHFISEASSSLNL